MLQKLRFPRVLTEPRRAPGSGHAAHGGGELYYTSPLQCGCARRQDWRPEIALQRGRRRAIALLLRRAGQNAPGGGFAIRQVVWL